jgi:exodeoxyribonuclease VII large subunit
VSARARSGLFDPDRRSPRPENDPETGRPKALTVSELTRQVKARLEPAFPDLWVEGEISNFKRYGSGHCYFTLKDEASQVSSVLWRGSAEMLRFEPTDGLKVLAHGRVSVYEPRGQYQLVVDRLEPSGVGALAAAFEALKAKLAAEGLFDEERKRPLPKYPQRIALVTSPSGAAIRDLIKVILGRWPLIELIVAPVRVQGDGAAAEIAAAIKTLNALRCADVMIVGRGGGSMEDLWAFNEEIVARAIVASEIPVISAVGHEVDFTIADFVADVRAATPSHAGEMVVAELQGVIDHLNRLQEALPDALLNRVLMARERLKTLAGSWAMRYPEERLEVFRQRLDDLQARLSPLGLRAIEDRGERIESLAARLEGLSPLKVLARGYSVTSGEDGRIVRAAKDVKIGEVVLTRLAKGRLRSKVEGHDLE